MKKRKGRSMRSRLNLWYTVLMCVLSVGLLASLLMAARFFQRSQIQQELIRTVERNIDEIEVENSLLDIESDFAYKNDGIFAVVYAHDGKILGGSIPDGLTLEKPYEKGHIEKIDGYYIYDTLVEFSKYEYKINGVTGDVISSEVEGVDSFTAFDGDLNFTGSGCVFSGKEVYEIALKATGISLSQAELISVRSYEYNSAPVYEVEFYSKIKAHDNIWVRGIVKANHDSGIWGMIINITVILLFIINIVSFFVGSVITKKAMEPVRILSREVAKTRSGNDLTKRISINDSDPEILRLSDNFNEMFSRLQRSFEAERQFSGDVSHELRTPTAVILAECEYQLTRDELDGEDREGFESVMKQANSMKSIVSQLQYFTKLEQGREEINLEQADLSELVSTVCDDISMLDNKGITLKKEIEKDLSAKIDLMLMTRLVTNLVSNAYRYGKENGTVTVKLKKQGDKTVLEVIDDGIGISQEHLPKIWNRFYRVDKARSREEGCSGLGLAMVKQIALLHGGEVYAESEEGKGSRFVFEM